MKKRILSGLEIISKSIVQPLMYLSVVGIIMVLGVLITNKSVVEFLPFLQWEPIQFFGNLVYKGLMAIINNLSGLFAIGIAAALAKNNKHHAAIISFISYIIFLTANNVSLESFGKLAEPDPMLGLFGTGQGTVLGIQVLDTGVFSGIILGFIVGLVYNKTSEKTFKRAWLQMWAGSKWSLLWMIFISLALGFITIIVWPPIQNGIESITTLISNTGNFGLFLYGFAERILIPTGLHHLIYTPFQFSALGGSIQMGGETISGALAIYMAEMNNPATTEFSDSIRWMQIAFTKTFGYIGIAAAFIKTAKPENKAKIKAMLIPLVVTSFMVSITEPIDFLFVFAAPVLFLLHAIIAGTFLVILNLLNINAATSGLSGIILNFALGTEMTKWPLLLGLALVQILLYYFLFSFLIKKFNMKTPGREESQEATPDVEDNIVSTKKKESELHAGVDERVIIEGLGGQDNIIEVDNCFTRLRVELKDSNKTNKDLLNQTNNSGVVIKGNDVQVIYGLGVEKITQRVKKTLNELKGLNEDGK